MSRIREKAKEFWFLGRISGNRPNRLFFIKIGKVQEDRKSLKPLPVKTVRMAPL
jgi:hypothetical protein